ncbi:MAG: FAD:protein FMN transferase, partial [Candidatus Omnitrophica bacterium]|nr:FAD:protein FMN transferase [Candidatus Omnitrophota bacterium]
EISRIENLLSKYKEDSEIAKLNKLGKLKASPDTFYILEKTKEFCKLTDGAFDISVGPLMDLWGFTDGKYRVPDKALVSRALEKTGADKIILNINDNMVKFKLHGMKLDLGGVAKGYALDCAVKKLKENGIKSCLINAGGQVYCLGDKFGKPWIVAAHSPRGKSFSGYLKLKDKSAATSGDYEQYFVSKNKRYCHIIDPRTGYPADSGVISVTVTAPDGLTADVLSTSVFILGKEKGLALIKEFPGACVEIIEESNVQDNP